MLSPLKEENEHVTRSIVILYRTRVAFFFYLHTKEEDWIKFDEIDLILSNLPITKVSISKWMGKSVQFLAYFKKKLSIDTLYVYGKRKKLLLSPWVEPGSTEWKPEILTARPYEVVLTVKRGNGERVVKVAVSGKYNSILFKKDFTFTI